MSAIQVVLCRGTPLWCLLLVCWISARAAEKPPEHPLLPGVRSPEVWNNQWPGTLHDKLLSGFSPLECGMKKAPKVLATIHPGGQAMYAAFLADEKGAGFLLVKDGSLRRIDAEGNVVWRRPANGILFYDRLHGDGTYTLGATQGSSLVLIEPATGEAFWRQQIEGSIGPDKVRVARLLPDCPGKQIVVFPQYVTMAYMFAFPEGGRQPRLVWKTNDAAVANWPPRADHGVSTIVEPDGSTIWNIRHHTINTHDPKTGRLLRRFEFQSGGGKRRNYGPSVIGQSANAVPQIAIVGQFVQHHLSCFTRSQSTSPSLILDRYVGEVYQDHGVRSWFPLSGLGDVDGDGGLDIVYSVRLTQPKPHTQTIFCNLSTAKEQIIPDSWLAGAEDIDDDGRKEIFVYADSGAEMPRRGELQIYAFDHKRVLTRIHSIAHAELVLRAVAPSEQPPQAAWGNVRFETPAVLHTSGGRAVLIRDHAARQAGLLLLSAGTIRRQPAPAVLFDEDLLAIGRWKPDGPWQLVMQSSEGRLRVVSMDGSPQFELPLSGGGGLLLSAADLTGNGRCELVVRTPHRRLHVYSFDSPNRPRLAWSAPFAADDADTRLGVPARDINGDGHVNLLGIGYSANNHLCARLLDADGKLIWESPLPLPGSGEIRKWVVGDFFAPGHSGIFISCQQGLAREESYMLDGKTGRVVWTGLPQDTPGGVRACNPVGIPTAFDADGDGKEDLMLDYRDFVAVHRGFDGKLIRNITSMPSVPAGWKMAYNSFTPVYRQGQQKPDFLIPLGHGGIGLIGNDLKTEIWTHKPYYDTPAKLAMIDADGDGRLEVGYEEKRDGQFVCRDLWTGKQEWRLKLDGRGFGPAISADFDGDGKGEFLIGGYCIGTDANGQGQIRWRLRLPVGSGWPAIADLDGDGLGEIIMSSSDGLIHILTAESD